MSAPDNSEQVVAANTRISLHFSLALVQGDIIDSTRQKAPATFVFGDGNLLPNFEKLLLGLHVGARRSFVLESGQAFGEYVPENEQAFPRTQFARAMNLEQGMLIAFADASGEELPGLIKSMNEQFVLIDFNHPLAGKAIVFDVEILAVERLNAESLIQWIEARQTAIV